MSYHNLEILAPAGNREAFLAAVAGGANAVYLGGKNFGARAYANNFDLEDMAALFCYAHLRDVKVYVTVNTLISDGELPQALEYIKKLYELGADAIIIQDLGLFNLVKKFLPNLPLNASTQMVIHNSLGAKMAEDLGFKRVILARETPIETMGAIKKAANIETEVFVHGALCICYSGQCLFSSLVGGRSGNRGRCAQPCRLPYALLDEKGKEIAKGHLLSPKDLKALELLEEIEKAGVTSVKIEGRMKRSEYVAAVTRVYADGEATSENRAKLSASFNREFSTGYLLQNQGADLMSYNRPSNRGTRLGRIIAVDYNNKSLTVKLDAPLNLGDGLEIWVSKGGRQGFTVESIFFNGNTTTNAISKQEVELACPSLAKTIQNIKVGDRIFKNYDSLLAASAESSYEEQVLLPIIMNFEAKLEEKPKLVVSNAKGQSGIAVADFIIPLAQKHPADRASIEKQLARLGGSGYKLAELNIKYDEGIMLPASVLNNLRRDAIKNLEEIALAPWQREKMHIVLPQIKAKKAKADTKIAVYVDDMASAMAAKTNGAAIIYVGSSWQGVQDVTVNDIKQLADNYCKVYYTLPVIASEQEIPAWQNKLAALRETAVLGIAAGNLWSLQLLKDLGWGKEIIGDFGLNIFNSQTIDFYENQGLSRACLSLELNWQQIENIGTENIELEALAYGNLPMMISEHCMIGALAGGRTAKTNCRKACFQGHEYILKDEKGFVFPVEMDKSCRMHLFNGHQLCMLEDTKRFIGNGIAVMRLDLRRHKPEQVTGITAVFNQALTACKNKIEPNYVELKERIAKFAIGSFTKGHYYRGVE